MPRNQAKAWKNKDIPKQRQMTAQQENQKDPQEPTSDQRENNPQWRNSTTQRDNLNQNSAPSTNQQVKQPLPTKRENHQ